MLLNSFQHTQVTTYPDTIREGKSGCWILLLSCHWMWQNSQMSHYCRRCSKCIFSTVISHYSHQLFKAHIRSSWYCLQLSRDNMTVEESGCWESKLSGCFEGSAAFDRLVLPLLSTEGYNSYWRGRMCCCSYYRVRSVVPNSSDKGCCSMGGICLADLESNLVGSCRIPLLNFGQCSYRWFCWLVVPDIQNLLSSNPSNRLCSWYCCTGCSLNICYCMLGMIPLWSDRILVDSYYRHVGFDSLDILLSRHNISNWIRKNQVCTYCTCLERRIVCSLDRIQCISHRHL